jgi:hypothetical protein
LDSSVENREVYCQRNGAFGSEGGEQVLGMYNLVYYYNS